MSAPAVGIDLGTTNSVVAVSVGGRPQVLTDAQGQSLVPSVVSFLEGGERLVGRAARQRRAVDPTNTVYSVKRLLGRPFKSEEVRRARTRMAFELKEGADSAVSVATRGGLHSLPELSAMVLREVRRIAEENLKAKVERCVITVPANFNELQRSSTKIAGRIAELDVIRILNEPTAAALAYGYGRGTREKICIFDFGGGTFDVTLLELAGNVFEVLATAGDTFLGGDDINVSLTESLAQPFQRATKVDINNDRAMFDVLRDLAEMAKCELSLQESTQIDAELKVLNRPALRFKHTLSRADLETVAAPYISRTFDVCAEALKLASLRPTDLTAVILVGGSTRIPAVRQRVSQFFGRDPLTSLPPEEVVALGASILAEALTGGARRAHGRPATTTSRVPPPQSAPPGPSPTMPPAGVSTPTAAAPFRSMKPTPVAVGIPGHRPAEPGSAPRETIAPAAPKGGSVPPRRPGTTTAEYTVTQGEVRPVATSSPSMPRLSAVPKAPGAPLRKATSTSGDFDLDLPFAERISNDLPKVEDQVLGRRDSGSLWEPVKTKKPTLGTLDEPSFMGRLPRAPDDPAPTTTTKKPSLEFQAPGSKKPSKEIVAPDDTTQTVLPGAKKRSKEFPEFNLEDSFMGPLPEAVPSTTERKKEEPSGSFSLDDDPLASMTNDPLSSPTVRDPLASSTGVRDPLASPTTRRPVSSVFGAAPSQDSADQSDLSMSFSLSPDDIFGPPGEKKEGPSAAAIAAALAAASMAGNTVRPSTAPPAPAPQAPVRPPPVRPMDPGIATQRMPSVAPIPTQTQAPQLPPSPAPPMAPPSGPVSTFRAPTMPPVGPDRPPLPPAPSSGGTGSSATPFPSGQTGPTSSPFNTGTSNIPTPVSATGSRSAPFPMPGGTGAPGAPSGLGGSGPSRNVPLPGAPLLLDVTPFSLGVETAGGLCETVIRRNATIPVEQTRVFATTNDDQVSVIIRIAQGESRRFADNQLLGSLELAGLRPAPRGEVAIAVTFELEADGTMRVRARDTESGREQAIRVALLTLPTESAQAEMAVKNRATAATP